ncbi:MAG: hypothetical protein RJB03_992 [Bacteroidota bacterium]|jgi:hypothetical protein
MKYVSKLVYLLVWGMGSFWGCSTPEGFKSPEDPLDAGREFIRALLDGDYEKGSLYVLNDPEDQEIFKRYERYMKKQPKKELLNLKSASIIINTLENQGDSISIINFSNSHSMKPMDLKVVKADGEWKIDLSYTFSGNLPLE